MPHTSEIEKALDDLAIDESGMKFQALAVVLAKQRWPRLVACERKKDLGLDAYASGELEPDGNGFGLACSLTPEYEKIAADATKVKKNFPDVRVLAFATAGKVSNYRAKQWAKELRKDFDLKLIVLPRQDLVTSLIETQNANICRAQLGIHVEVSPALAPIAERALEALNEVIESWSSRPRLAARPLIDLDAERVEEATSTRERLSVESLRLALAQGRRIILEAPAGRGKTTTLLQIARRTLDAAGLAFLIDLPAWVKSGTEILKFVTQAPAFAGRGLDVNALLRLRGSEPFFFLLNGWNEISEGTAEAAVQELRELERNYPSAGIIVATRTHRLRPPLPGAFRAKLLTLSRQQRDGYLAMVLGESANELRAKLNNSQTLDELTRTPLILAEVTDLFQKRKPIPSTKMGILAAVIQMVEDSDEHQSFLHEPPLNSNAGEYLCALSMAMSEKSAVEIEEADARGVVTSVSVLLQKNGQLAALPEPANVLNGLSKHHVLERLTYPGVAFRFQHQQFQEFFAARGLRGRLLNVVRSGDVTEGRKFAKQYVNEPKWGESLRMLAEDVAALTGAEGSKKEIAEAGAKLIRMALHVDPLFASELSRASAHTVWPEIRGEVGQRLRAWYAQEDGHHKQCALAAMLATGSHDFKDVLVPLLTDSDNQVRLAVIHAGVGLLPSSLGPDWQDVVKSWPEAARLDFLTELTRDPWLADAVEKFALSDPSPKVRWNVAHGLSWAGFTEKVEALLAPLDDESFQESLRASHPDDIPASLRWRAVALHERSYAETSDPLEHLRILRILQGFGGEKIAERLKADLDGLGPESLKSENQARVRWALEELQKSDSDWVSAWVARKLLDKSTWFGPPAELITRIPSQERESLYTRLSTEVLDVGEEQRVRSILASQADESFASCVFNKACEIRRGLSLVQGQDQPKWNLFRQLVELLKAMGPQKMLGGVLDNLDEKPDLVELEMLTDGLPAMNPVRADTRSSVSEETRLKLRNYLKKGAELGAAPDGLRASTRAHLAQLLANVGEPEDLKEIRRLIEADRVRFQAAQEARMKGDRSHDEMGYGLLYFDAVTTVDPIAADDVLVELIRQQEYEWVLAQRLPLLARRSSGPQGLGKIHIGFAKIWKARAGEPDDTFVEARRSRYADAILGAIQGIKEEREGATDKRGFDHRLKILAGALAALDGKRSANLVLELIELPTRWDGWTRVRALESLLLWGARFSLEEVLRILDPVIQEVRASGIYSDNQNAWLFAHCLSVMAFVEQPAAGVAKIRELLSDLRFRPHELVTPVTALGASRCDDAIDVLMELAGDDGKGIEALREPWIEAIRALGGKRADQVLLSFVDPNANVFTRDFIPDYKGGDVLARLLAERAAESGEFKAELVRLANGDVPAAKRLLLAKCFGRSRTEEDLVEGLCVLRDNGSGVPYEFLRSIEDVVLERRPYGTSGNAYTLSPLGCNAVRKRLFEMAIGDQNRKRSAFALIGRIELWRLEHGRPPDEPRHPAIESNIAWPPLLSWKPQSVEEMHLCD